MAIFEKKRGHFNTYSFRIMTQSGVAKFDFFEIFYSIPKDLLGGKVEE